MGANIEYYARKGGWHIHSNKECIMLAGGQFEHYGYKEVSLDEAQERQLHLCSCVNKTFDSHHRLTITNLKRFSRR